MAELYINPQLRPAAATTSDLYTVPASARTLISTAVIANDSATASIARITVAPLGAADATVQRVVPNVSVPANTVVGLTLGITLKATDVVRCRSDSGAVNFHLFGVEKS